MTPADNLRRKAWKVRQDLGFAAGELVEADRLLHALDVATGFSRYSVPADDPTLAGAQAMLYPAMESIFLAADLPPATSRYDAAHEYAHWYLHRSEASCSEIDMDLDLQEFSASATVVVDGYSVHERAESEANTFAAELLLPLHAAKTCYETLQWTSAQIADAVGISDGIAKRQLTEALLVPIPSFFVESKAGGNFELDSSQRDAAEHETGPLLLSAGPGTGKTRTLVARSLHLVNERMVPAAKILALTYSRRAASEMAERLAAAGIGGEKAGPWIGTFHSFGTELLRKYGHKNGLNPEFKVIDQLDAATLLENNLQALKLNRLQSLRNPTVHFGAILKQISHAKDELVDPEHYALRAAELKAEADRKVIEFTERPDKKTKTEECELDDLLEKAERSIEVARVYDVYEHLKREIGLLDYSDLIYQSVSLLNAHPSIRAEIHSHYPHVLADEYQDVNRASARLLRLIAGPDASGLWVVGDHRQSIYQFQGASPANISLFKEEYSEGVLKELSVNYRSVPEVVETFSIAAEAMSFSKLSQISSHWNTVRSGRAGSAPVQIAELPSHADQARFMADMINEWKGEGGCLMDIAVLCRTHRQANDIAKRLNGLGVSSQYLGPLLDRPEIKNLIGVLGACASDGGPTAFRMMGLSEYAIPNEDRCALIRNGFMDENSLPLSPAGEAGYSKLRAHITLLRQYLERPSSLLRAYLFDVSKYLTDLALLTTPFEFVQQKLAIRQFIAIVEDFDRRPIRPLNEKDAANKTARLLNYLHRLTLIGGAGMDLSEDADMDAVRIATVHSVKGLEFPVVFVPNLNSGDFPAFGRHDGLPDLLAAVPAEESDEEECLFFVALSRARDRLYLTHTRTKLSGAPAKPSELLQTVQKALDAGVLRRVEEPKTLFHSTKITSTCDLMPGVGEGVEFGAAALEQYLRCPRSYYFANVVGMRKDMIDDGYYKMVRVIDEYLCWVDGAPANERDIAQAKMAKLEDIWTTHGPVGHHHEALYRSEVEAAVQMSPSLGAYSAFKNLKADLPTVKIKLKADHLAHWGDKVVITQRIIGLPNNSDRTDKKLALVRKAAQDSYPGKEVMIRLRYTRDGSIVEVPAAPRYEPGRINKYEAAAAGIASMAFPAAPASSDSCRTCAFLLACSRKDS